MSARVGASAVAVTASVCGRPSAFVRFFQPDIFRAEVVPPLRNAMRLVDGEEIDFAFVEQRERVVAKQPLGRDIEQPQLAAVEPVEDRAPFPRVGDGIEGGGFYPITAHLRDLIAHQRYQRRDDDGQTCVEQRRKLEQQGFAAAGRHDGEHVLPAEDRFEDFGLSGAEVGEAEDPMERLAGVVQSHGRNTGVHCTSSMLSAPQASIARRSKPSAAPAHSLR
jgi:hypothetical protein